MYNVHKNMGAHYTREHTVQSKIWYLGEQKQRKKLVSGDEAG